MRMNMRQRELPAQVHVTLAAAEEAQLRIEAASGVPLRRPRAAGGGHRPAKQARTTLCLMMAQPAAAAATRARPAYADVHTAAALALVALAAAAAWVWYRARRRAGATQPPVHPSPPPSPADVNYGPMGVHGPPISLPARHYFSGWRVRTPGWQGFPNHGVVWRILNNATVIVDLGRHVWGFFPPREIQVLETAPGPDYVVTCGGIVRMYRFQHGAPPGPTVATQQERDHVHELAVDAERRYVADGNRRLPRITDGRRKMERWWVEEQVILQHTTWTEADANSLRRPWWDGEFRWHPALTEPWMGDPRIAHHGGEVIQPHPEPWPTADEVLEHEKSVGTPAQQETRAPAAPEDEADAESAYWDGEADAWLQEADDWYDAPPSPPSPPSRPPVTRRTSWRAGTGLTLILLLLAALPLASPGTVTAPAGPVRCIRYAARAPRQASFVNAAGALAVTASAVAVANARSTRTVSTTKRQSPALMPRAPRSNGTAAPRSSRATPARMDAPAIKPSARSTPRVTSIKQRPRAPRHNTPAAPSSLAHILDANDDSPYAFRPADPAAFAALTQAVDATIDAGVNPRTAGGERSAWQRYYEPFCRRLNTTPWRGLRADTHPVQEGIFATAFALDTWGRLKPRKRKDTAPRVDSLNNIIRHVRRKHDRKGMKFARSTQMKHLLRGIARRRLAEHGVAIPERAEPLTIDEECRMKDLPAGRIIAGRVYDPHDRYWMNWRMVDTYTDQTGTRKAEIVGFDDIYFTRGDQRFRVDGVTYVDPPPEVLRRYTCGRDLVLVAVNVSKADFDGSRFGPSLVASLYNRANPMSYAVAAVDYELRFPLRGAARRSAPLFTPDGKSKWTASRLDATFAGVMAATLTPAERVGKTLHSKRVTAGTGFTDINSSESETQALVRWSTPESLRLYNRMSLSYQAMRRDLLITAKIDALNANRLPTIDGDSERAGDAAALADALDADSDNE